jgi:hypothetical protein
MCNVEPRALACRCSSHSTCTPSDPTTATSARSSTTSAAWSSCLLHPLGQQRHPAPIEGAGHPHDHHMRDRGVQPHLQIRHPPRAAATDRQAEATDSDQRGDPSRDAWPEARGRCRRRAQRRRRAAAPLLGHRIRSVRPLSWSCTGICAPPSTPHRADVHRGLERICGPHTTREEPSQIDRGEARLSTEVTFARVGILPRTHRESDAERRRELPPLDVGCARRRVTPRSGACIRDLPPNSRHSWRRPEPRSG